MREDTIFMRRWAPVPSHTMEGSASMDRTPPRTEQSKGAREDFTTTAGEVCVCGGARGQEKKGESGDTNTNNTEDTKNEDPISTWDTRKQQ